MDIPIRLERTITERLAALKGADPAHGQGVLEEIHREVGLASAALNARLLGSALQWTDADQDAAAEMGAVHHELARAAYRFTRTLAGRADAAGAMERAAAMTLHATGDALKSDAVAGRAVPTDYAGLHTLMREAIARSTQRAPVSIAVAGSALECTLEALYFRALLLARFAGGTLNSKQIEILDAWIWMWLPVLRSTAQPPPGAALRADLDSTAGLARGARGYPGPSLYLPQDPIEAAYRALRSEFENGRIVPGSGLAASFRIEEHVAVLELIGRGLKESRSEPVARAPRRPGGLSAELHVGLTELGTRGQEAGPPPKVPVALATSAGMAAGMKRRENERDVALAEIYEPLRRVARIVDESDSGFCLEGALADCGHVAVRDLVAVRLRPGEPLAIGCVARVSPDTRGRILMGVKRLTSAARAVAVLPLDPPEGAATLLFVPGAERSGTQDGFLVPESRFARTSRIEVAVDGARYVLRFNRVRERGRGWVLAGFVVMEVRGAGRLAIG